ncbi:AhpC/TSA family protein [Roseimicrobium gellanilyticum]|uniref:AhpC/TSA family protein n=1 Tax=Roseimicrobium gellanilyticum TaxID=748857 RepID=A0A366HQJ2_9BACT|nr:thioredoxin family protein [Roseimicrobium gellanilyticum]RBP45921.1 AhpC/TSA family protein [Roseimicrobium gellanilyticum]
MAEVPSTRILPLGAPAPDFSLPEPGAELVTLADVREPKGLIVAFLCNHCPFVLHLAKHLGEFAAICEAKGVGFVGISSNDVSRYPADSPEKMQAMVKTYDWTFPYLYDETQSVAQAYRAACTPDFYVFDHELRLTYCGQFDDSRPKNGKPVTGDSLRAAVQALLDGSPPLAEQRPSTGCNIKWKPGNEPSWYAS